MKNEKINREEKAPLGPQPWMVFPAAEMSLGRSICSHAGGGRWGHGDGVGERLCQAWSQGGPHWKDSIAPFISPVWAPEASWVSWADGTGKSISGFQPWLSGGRWSPSLTGGGSPALGGPRSSDSLWSRTPPNSSCSGPLGEEGKAVEKPLRMQDKGMSKEKGRCQCYKEFLHIQVPFEVLRRLCLHFALPKPERPQFCLPSPSRPVHSSARIYRASLLL